MKERSYIELLSNRVYTRGISAAESEPMSSVQLERSGFSGRPIGDRYSPIGRIGRGRLGEIYEAEDAAGRDLGVVRRVALQRIDDRIVAKQQFIDELESGYALLRAGTHPNVVKTIDFFRDGKGYYLVMEFLEGVSLRSVLDEAAPEALSLDETSSVLRAVGDGLEYLHAKAMVHGDVRPANVFITFDYAVKLLDVAPMSPLSGVPHRVEDAEEGARSRDVRDDVYDLACLGYELLSGRHPFNASSPHDAHRAGLTVAPLPHLTVRQWEAMARGLALQRARRTPSVAQFLSEFGISGTQRLRAPADVSAPPHPEAQVVPLRAAAPAVQLEPPRVAAPLRAPEPLRPIYVNREPKRQAPESSMLRGLLLFVVLVGLGVFAFWDFDALRLSAARFTADLAPDAVPPPATPAPQPMPQAALDPTGVASEPTEAGSGQAAPVTSAAAPAGAGVTAEAAPTPPPAPPPAVEELPTETVEPNVVATVRNVPPRSRTAERAEQPSAAPTSPAFRFAQPVMTISEGQTAAAIVIERSAAGSPATVVWWVSGDTAVADDDYANLGQRTERFGAGELSRTIYVPLVVDTLPERTETFFVYLGQRDAGRGRLQQLANIRVNIRDDD